MQPGAESAASRNNCTSLILDSAARQPGRFALWFTDSGTHSFGDLLRAAGAAQSCAKSIGLARGDSVLLLEPLSLRLYGLIIGLAALGITVVLVEPWMPVARINAALAIARPRAFFSGRTGFLWGARVPAVRAIGSWINAERRMSPNRSPAAGIEVAPVSPQDIAILTFTSGTTGDPKGVPRRHGYLFSQGEVFLRAFGYEPFSQPDICIFANFALANLAAGRGSLVVPPRRTPTAWQALGEAVRAQRPISATANPNFVIELLRRGLASHLQEVHVGGALIDRWILEEGARLNPAAHWKVVYGSTEAEPVAIGDAAEAVDLCRQKQLFQVLCLGRPVDGLCWRPEADTVWVSGPHVCPHYLGSPADNEKNKRQDPDGTVWHNMGDRIVVENGLWWYSGREKQAAADFELEQDVYRTAGSSKAFLTDGLREEHGRRRLIHAFTAEQAGKTARAFPELELAAVAAIKRDARHQSRIDRIGTLQEGFRVKNIFAYLKQRFPVASYLIICSGFAWSGWGISQAPWSWTAFLSALGSLLLFFMTLRAMDEVKDFDKDKVANPDRPLPRGLISLPQAKRVALGLMLAFAFSNAASGAPGASSAFHWVTVAYLALMYFEFGIGGWLNRRPFLYALSHQFIVLLLAMSSAAVYAPDGSTASMPVPDAAAWGVGVLGAFFCYEIARKLDPAAHPLLRTYRSVYGLPWCTAVTAVLAFAAAAAFQRLGLPAVSVTAFTAMLACYLLLIKDRLSFKTVEAVATVNLLAHILAPALRRLLFG